VDDDELMTIGRFARMSGVSIHALRHYDEVALLAPAQVDAASGYRHYRPDQIQRARLIRALRGMDLPIEGIRQILAAGSDDEIRGVLIQHRERLERERGHLSTRIDDVTDFLERGLTMPIIQTGCRPVLLQLAVEDRDTAIAFYQKAFGWPFDVIRRTADGDYSSFMFGKYGQDSFFFLLILSDDPERCDHPGPTTVGFLVEDLAAAHSRAVTAGATETVAPHAPEGMPRCSAVRDPSGNWIWLYQGDSGCRPIQIKVTVADLKASIDFYHEAFGLRYDVIRRTGEETYSSFTFGEYGQDDHFLLTLLQDDQLDRPGRATFSLLVDDLDTVHARALSLGATEGVAPYDAEGKPRSSAVLDPSGNWVGLAQG
jgi:predicted enzyme related to lactoylglutathione lyase